MTHPQQAASTPAPSKYGFHCVLKDPNFANAIAAVTEALKAEGFGILTEIDVQATMKASSTSTCGPTASWAPATRRWPTAH